jgi:hypothetical protein
MLVLAAAFLVLMCVSLCKRAWRGDSDFGVFYRAAVSLAAGAGGEMYAERDAPTGWYNCIPPAGMMIFQGLGYVHRLAAGIIWMLANLCMLWGCLAVLRRIYAKLGDEGKHYEATLPYALIVLAIFGGVCLQTGQTSILFTLCWLGYVLSTSLNKNSWSGFLLALPAAIKLYPLMFGLIPVIRRKWPEVAWGIVWIVGLTAVIPLVFYRENLVGLLSSFFQYQVLDPNGRVMTAATQTAPSNQGIDSVLLRYFSYVPGLHGEASVLPHANIDPGFILSISNGLRLAILAFTAFASLRWLRANDSKPPFIMMALWCAALYMVLPGQKGRYAIYVLPAILVMFAAAHRAFANGLISQGKRITALAVVACVLLVQLVPDELLRYGVGYVGTIILWTFMLKEAITTGELSRRAGENYAADRKGASDVL